MRSLVRTRSSRLGERSNAITSSSGYGLEARSRFRFYGSALASNFLQRVCNERRDRPCPKVAGRSTAHGNGPFGHFAVAGDEHVWHLLKLRLPDFIINLLLAVVQLDSQPGGGQPLL